MSPASAGSLEVERYIGACLISSQHRNKTGIVNAQSPGGRDVYYPRDRYVHQDVYNNSGYQVSVDNRYRPRRCNSVDGWAGGMPLISFANNHRRNRRPDVPDTRSSSPRVAEDVPVSTPLSRLAVHTQGVPLILSGRHNNRRNKNSARRDGVVPQNRPIDATNKKDNSSRAVDSLSVASDESSGSNNSETCLPRIIKPRKRRKKDRKPHATRPPSVEGHQDACNGGSSSIVTLKPYVVPYCYTRDRVFPPRYISTYSNSESDKSVGERRVSVSVSVTDSDLSEAPQLHHKFEDVVGPETEIEQQQPSSCQCRYCDPAGQIWDVDRHCYSPFLTTPTFRHDHPPFVDPSATISKRYLTEKISSALENQCLISTFSLDLETSGSGSGSSSGDDSPRIRDPFRGPFQEAEARSYRTAQCLEISTEIVTSHNGHRDLEIRLFSSSALGSRRLGLEPATSKAQSDTSSKCSAGERVCSLADDCGLQPEE